MNTKLWNLGSHDLVKGLITAVLTATVAALANAMQLPGFDFASFDWNTLLSIAISAAIGYLAKNFASDRQGRFMGKIG